MKRSAWLTIGLALVSAILAFRIASLVVSVLFLGMRWLPFCVGAFVHRWDTVMVPMFSICAAVLVSRWQERVLEAKSLRTHRVVFVIAAVLAFLPVRPQIYVRPVMCSPLELAIDGNYSAATVEALIDRYPEFINGREVEWDHYCPLVSAACEGRTGIVEILVHKGANVDYAIERLQQIEDEEAIAMILRVSQGRGGTVALPITPVP